MRSIWNPWKQTQLCASVLDAEQSGSCTVLLYKMSKSIAGKIIGMRHSNDQTFPTFKSDNFETSEFSDF